MTKKGTRKFDKKRAAVTADEKNDKNRRFARATPGLTRHSTRTILGFWICVFYYFNRRGRLKPRRKIAVCFAFSIKNALFSKNAFYKKIKNSYETDFNTSGEIQNYHGGGDLKKDSKFVNSKEMVGFESVTLNHQNIYN